MVVRILAGCRATTGAVMSEDDLFRQVVEHAADAMYLVAPGGDILDVNRASCEMLGYRRQELLELSILDIIDGMSPERLTEILQLIGPGTPWTGEYFHIRKDGSRVPVEVRVGAFMSDQRKLRVAFARDITKRQEAEKSLRQSEERFAGIFRSAMDAIIIMDSGGRIELFNEAAEKVFGCSTSEVTGQPLDRFLSPNLRAAIAESLHAFASGEETHRYLWHENGLTAIRATKEEFPVEATFSRFTVSGEPLYTIILRDVNEKTKSEARISRLEQETSYLREEIDSERPFGDFVGNSAAILSVFKAAETVAGTESTVLITGETGTGKELVARAIHSASTRSEKPLVKVNCAALPHGLIESELFGHEKGAFTGATMRRLGRFELADAGTIFLDEIGDMPVDVQVKLLRVLQEGEFERVGGTRTMKVNVRVVAATNRNLKQAVEDGNFRADLFYRLDVFPIHVPALRERPEDIPLLVRYFVAKFAARSGKTVETIPNSAMNYLLAYEWPGNVRELENLVERAVILTRGTELEFGDWLQQSVAGPDAGQDLALDDVQKNHILRVLKLAGGKVSGKGGAAELLGLKPTTLESRIKKLGIQRTR